MPEFRCALLLLCYHQLLGGVVSEFTPVVHTKTSSSQCGQYDPLQDEQLIMTLEQVAEQLPKQPTYYPSCKSIHNSNPSGPSGYYQINATNGSLVQVYCDMEGANCGGEGGWTRVAFVNMTKPGATCPQGLDQTMFNGAPYCGRFASIGPGCVSAVVDNIISYQQVCGRVLGYYQGGPDAFQPFNAKSIKFTLMVWLSCVVILVSIYGHMLLGMMSIQLNLIVVHVTLVAYNQLLHLLGTTTTVNQVELDALEIYSSMIHCGMDSSVITWRHLVAFVLICRGSSRH